jgi:Asp-tRNA(Asn)/Glu-tRNA(Gln) amidotransferase A subunit family amidase
MYRGRIAPCDAPAVVLLRAAGGIIVGVTRTDSGGLGVVTPEVINPVASDAIVGGSSGGSAAAVAGGFAHLGLGTDTGGSVRIPAACCRLFGFKPSHGRAPSDGVWPLAPELEDIGVIAANLATLTAAANVLLRTACARPSRSRRLVIGIDSDRVGSCDAAVAGSFLRSMQRLERAGCELREVELPSRAMVSTAHGALVLEAAKAVYAQAWRERDAAGLGPTVQRALELAHGQTREALAEARRVQGLVLEAWGGIMAGCDYVATPTLPIKVPKRGTRRARLEGVELPMSLVLTAETSLANVLGVPAIAMPAPYETESVQLMAAAGWDEALLRDAGTLSSMLGSD